MRAALRFHSSRIRSGRIPRTQSPVDRSACDEIQAQIPAMIAALGHAEVLEFLERCIVAVQADQEKSLCNFLSPPSSGA